VPERVASRDLAPLDVEICVGAIPGEWTARAACVDADPEIFFPDRSQSYGPARRICAECPALNECRAYADRVEAEVRSFSWFGMFAGESPKERYRPSPGGSRTALSGRPAVIATAARPGNRVRRSPRGCAR
jgi:transcription factor WhiB